MRIRSVLISTVAAAALVLGAAVPAQATASPTVSLASVPSTFQLPKSGKTGSISITIRIANGGTDVFDVQTAMLSQGKYAAPLYADEAGGTSAHFTTQGGSPFDATVGGKQKLSVQVTDATTGVSLPLVTKTVTLVAHDTVAFDLGSSTASYKVGKKMTIVASTSINGVGAVAKLYFAKHGSKKFHVIATTKVKKYVSDSYAVIGQVTFHATKLRSGGKVYVRIGSVSSPKHSVHVAGGYLYFR